MQLQLDNKIALITGSTAGIGRATARQLLQEGAQVILNGRSQERVDAAVQALSQEYPQGKVSGIAADFADAAQVQALIDQVPRLDILINNVSIFEPKPFEDIPDEDWHRFYEVNVMSGVRLSRHYLPLLLQQGWGRILFISSESAINIPEEMIHYGMTKTAQLAISRGLAERTKGTAVTVNSILPGPTRSEGVVTFVGQLARANQMTDEEMEMDFFRKARPSSLLQRFATVEEIASFITYVASPLSAAINGAALRIDGGIVKAII